MTIKYYEVQYIAKTFTAPNGHYYNVIANNLEEAALKVKRSLIEKCPFEVADDEMELIKARLTAIQLV